MPPGGRLTHRFARALVWQVACVLGGLASASNVLSAGELRGSIVDAETGRLLPARLYIHSADRWYHARSAAPDGSALPYSKQRGLQSIEIHTTLSAHPFVAELPPGKYRLTAERGKDFHPAVQEFEIGEASAVVKLPLHRWIDTAARGWFSGDTHVHRPLEEMANLLPAEDLNVAFPLTYWVTQAHTPPSLGDKSVREAPSPAAVFVAPRHLYFPMNTEYELFTIGKRRHTQGAVFVLNHQKPLERGTPPVRPIAAEARRQGALLELDKHSWPWSMMIATVMPVDLFELSNNHVWRTAFGFPQWSLDTKPDHVAIETDEQGFTERGWIHFGFETYYTLLNCGVRMRPTAGTANGVHPVPLGFGRVYVQLPGELDARAWIDGLRAGRSFVTTGPMLFVEYNGRPPGHDFRLSGSEPATCRVTGTAESAQPLDRIELVVNGEVVRVLEPANQPTPLGGFVSSIDETVDLEGSGWVVARCFESHPQNCLRFAHGSPVHFEVPGKPLRPRKAEVQYLIGRMKTELARNADVLAPEELDEYRQALRHYQELATEAR